VPSRRFTQAAATIIANPWLYYFKSRTLFNRGAKGICFPGMNCYACPLAMYSCPIGSLQHSLASRSAGAVLYVVGTLGAIGALVGRIPCGWVCPFGLLQDLMYKVPLPKLRLPRWAGYFKYVCLGILAVLLPLVVRVHWFSRLCPVGALEGGIPLQALPPAGVPRAVMAPGLFFWLKIAILAVFLLWMMSTKRPFCRTACPLGAILSLFNPVSLYRLQVDRESCNKCGKCREVCPVDINVCDNPNSPECVRCLECKKACPCGSVTSGFRSFRPLSRQNTGEGTLTAPQESNT
jgi:ferredoxin-type protein NapH